MFKVKINVRNEIPMSESVKIDLLFVKIAPQIKKLCLAGTDGGHFGKRCFFKLSPKNREGRRSSFLRSPSKVPKTTKKLSFHENGHGIQKNDPTKCYVSYNQLHYIFNAYTLFLVYRKLQV